METLYELRAGKQTHITTLLWLDYIKIHFVFSLNKIVNFCHCHQGPNLAPIRREHQKASLKTCIMGLGGRSQAHSMSSKTSQIPQRKLYKIRSELLKRIRKVRRLIKLVTKYLELIPKGMKCQMSVSDEMSVSLILPDFCATFYIWGWRVAIKSHGYSCRGQGFNSQHTYGSLQAHITPVQRDPMTSLTFSRHQACTWYIFPNMDSSNTVCKQIYMWVQNNMQKREKERLSTREWGQIECR